MTTVRSKFDFEQLSLRLERNHQCVLRLSKNLNSYTYEPKNYECFTRLRELKSAFSDLAEKQKELFDKMQHQLVTIDVAREAVEQSIEHYHKLEKGMAKYLLDL
jgi:hypothetical protein